MNTYLIIGYSSILSVLIPLSFATIQWDKLPRDISTLRWLLIIGLISDVFGSILGSYGIHNLWVGDVLCLSNSQYYSLHFSRQFQRKNVFLAFLSIVISHLSAFLFANQAIVTLCSIQRS